MESSMHRMWADRDCPLVIVWVLLEASCLLVLMGITFAKFLNGSGPCYCHCWVFSYDLPKATISGLGGVRTIF